jgi:hypothetical protein
MAAVLFAAGTLLVSFGSNLEARAAETQKPNIVFERSTREGFPVFVASRQ